jgi:hypothetical protein
MDFLRLLEQTSFATWVREGGSLWGYPTILFMHTMGMATVVGLSAAVDLRLLGLGPEVTLSSLARVFPIIWIGFLVNAASGSMLLLADATTKLINPVFYVKMIFIALALANLWIARQKIFNDPQVDVKPLPDSAKLLAISSLIFWAAATTAGRLMAYIGPVSGLEGLE